MEKESESRRNSGRGEFLSFFLGGEEFAFSLREVKEIVEMLEITPVPKAENFVAGLINLRGAIVPVIFLRKRLGLSEVEPTKDTVIIIVEKEKRLVGLIVDRIGEVLRFAKEEITSLPPVFESQIDLAYCQGIAKREEHQVPLINLEKILTVS
ncbi:MAG: chemotaxis protein CheW [Candidatus Edwardsbacteria bacterium]